MEALRFAGSKRWDTKDEPAAHVLAAASALSGALGGTPASRQAPGQPLRLLPEDATPPTRPASPRA